MTTKTEKKILRARSALRKIIKDMETIEWAPADRNNELLVTAINIQKNAEESLQDISNLYRWRGLVEPE